jgi:hypothetical protein
MVYQLYKQDGEAEVAPPAPNGTGAAIPSFHGGAVAVIDAITSTAEGEATAGKEDRQSISLNSVCKFLAHDESLELLSFSPSGVMMASAPRSGQVIHVHALASSALLFSSSAKTIAIKNRKKPYDQSPQLVYRLVRGFSLATVIHISFDSVESMALVGTNNGTVHVFDLGRHNTAAGLGHMGRNSSPVSSGELNGNGKSSSGSSGGSGGLGGGDGSSPAGSAPSSAPLSNMDELLTQFTSQRALDAAGDTAEGLKHLNTLIKEVYAAERMSLPSRDFVASPDGGSPVEEAAPTSTPAGISFVNAASAASDIGFTSLAAGISVLNSDSGGGSRAAKGSVDSHELYLLSSQGLLSRFRIPTARQAAQPNGKDTAVSRFGTGALAIPQLSGGINGLLNGNGQYPSHPREMNRWDLFASLEECADMEYVSASEHGQAASKPRNSKPGSSAVANVNGKSNTAAWLYAFGDIRGAAGSGVNPLWTRPQVTYKSRLNASGGAKKQSQATSGAPSPYSFLFPERNATESMGSSRQHHASGESGSVSILATISSALDNSPAEGAHPSGRHVASKKVAISKALESGGKIPAFDEDWEVPSEKDWQEERPPVELPKEKKEAQLPKEKKEKKETLLKQEVSCVPDGTGD